MSRKIIDVLHSGMVRLNKKVAMVDRESECSDSRLSILAVLVFGGNKTLGELSRIEAVKPPTITNLVKGLEAEGMVKRQSPGEDKRQTTVAVTKKGAAVLQKARQRRLDYLFEMTKGLSAREFGVLEEASEILLRLSDSFD